MRAIELKFVTVAAALTAMTGSAPAATTVTTFGVTTTLVSACAATATALTFPNYTPGAGAKIANSTISVKCTNGANFTVALGNGLTGNLTNRLLTTTGTPVGKGLDYNLYTSAALTTVWGGTTTQAGRGRGITRPRNLTVYGQLLDNANNQAFAPGSYIDTITVTVSY